MIGDACAAGKRHSTTAKGPEFKQKNSRGRSFKHIAKPKNGDPSGSDAEVDIPAAAATRGMRVGTGGKDHQAPHKQKERKEVKYMPEGKLAREARINDWVSGKRGSYK
jgi:hypothetical protein